jgi:tetratricopeptide (TPR) repeat protein
LILLFFLRAGVIAQSTLEADAEGNGPSVVLSQMALRSYEEKSADWPENKLLPIASAYYIAKDYEKAYPLFQRVLAKEPDNMFALLFCGATLARLEKYREAVPMLKRVWEKTQNVTALVKLAACYSQSADREALERIVPDLIAHKYEDIDHVLAAVCNYALFEPDTARATTTMEKALSGVPDGRIAVNSYLIEVACAALKRFKMPERETALEKAAEAQDAE